MHQPVAATLLLLSGAFLSTAAAADVAAPRPAEAAIYPGDDWEKRTPAETGLSAIKLRALAELVGGRGCVVRQGCLVYTWGDPARSGDIASAVKPLLSTLLLLAVQQGKTTSVDARVADFEPGLRALNRGKDAAITWRHLASQTSGYGLSERPGEAYAYNDFALALYYDALMRRVYQQDGTRVLKGQLGDVLGFQDRYTFEAFGPGDRPGRLAISVRDLARFGLLMARGGTWKERQVLKPELVRMALSSPVRADLPRTAGKDADMLPHQRSLGGGKDQTPAGPGYYSFNWWLNRTDKDGRRLYVDAPPDTFVAVGHGGESALWVIPSLDLIVVWNDAKIGDHDASPGSPKTKCNQAARLLRDAVRRRTHVAVHKDQWLLGGAVTYRGAKAEGRLMNVRMVNAVFEDTRRPDFDPEANTDRFVRHLPDYVGHGVRAFTINLQGGMPGYEGAVNSAFDADGNLRPAYLRRVRRVIEACDRQGAVVILGCFYQRQDQLLKGETAVRAGVVNVAQWLKGCGFTNVVLEIANEFGHGGFDHPLLRTAVGQVELIGLAKEAHPDLLVSTSGLGDGTVPREVARASDFILIHLNGTKTEDIPARLEALQGFGKPVVCNEDARVGAAGARAAEVCVAHGASWGLMAEQVNQHYPFAFRGAPDDETVYAALKQLTSTAAAERYKALLTEYQNASSSGRALSDEERLRFVGEVYKHRNRLALQFVELAEEYPQDPVAEDALIQAVWQVNGTPWPVELVGRDDAQPRALALLQRDHIRSDKFGTVCQRISFGFCQEYETFLRAVLEKNPHREIQAQACLGLAHFLRNRLQRLDLIKAQPDLAREFKDLFGKEYFEELQRQDRTRAAQEAEAFFEQAAQKYGNVKLAGGGTVGAKAKAELFEIRHLSVGKEAADIEGEDQDGKRFKLSDYRGKVVLLDFWSEY
jgi:CubicO group peptidase (beta-lactamase class C family)